MKHVKYIVIYILAVIGLIPSGAQANGTLDIIGPGAWAYPVSHASRSVGLVLENGLLMMEIEDVFDNPSDRRLEGAYRFRLPDQGFVTGFQIMTDGKTWVPGKIMEIAQARLAYDEIVTRQTDPGLMEQHGNELLIKVFPIEPRASVRIRFRCHAAAPALGDGIDLVLPVGVETEENDGPAFGAGNAGKRVKLKVAGTIRDTRGVAGVETEPASRVSPGREGETAFSLETAHAGSVRLQIRLKGSTGADIQGYAEPGGSRFLLARIPPLRAPERTDRARVTVLLDVSGSMGGKNRARADRLLKRLKDIAELDIHACTGSTLAAIAPGQVAEQGCSGRIAWGAIELPKQAAEADGTLLITDGEGLGAAEIGRLWTQSGRHPLWVALFAPEIPGELSAAFADKGGLVRLFEEAGWDAAETVLSGAMRDLGISMNIVLPGGERGVPLFGRLACGEGSEAFLVVPATATAATIRVVDRSGAALWEAADPGPGADLPARGWLTALVARQRILTLAGQPQTPDIVREITRLGLEHNLATEYTAFLAVPADIARQYADVLNPAFLGVFAPPNFRKAREQSRGKACFANQRVLLGAVEMYNMDHTVMMDRDPVTLALDIDKLTAEKFLKGGISKPDPACRYLAGPGSLLATGSIFCVRHGYIEGEFRKPPEEQFADACVAYGCNPDDFDIEFPADESPLEAWLEEYRPLLFIIRLFI
ncbi:MAG TPA: VIT domain-containing protein [Candidatus Ozemobacteraceae bacterium]|nr:VIT domain-containing protein [Candidatus Ozemobacteraceae bacterium]